VSQRKPNYYEIIVCKDKQTAEGAVPEKDGTLVQIVFEEGVLNNGDSPHILDRETMIHQICTAQ